MKKVLFLVSHLGAESSALCQMLDKNPRVQWCPTNLIYSHPDVLEKLTSYTHKLNNVAAIWLDEILFNHYFCHKALYQCCKFIYLVRPASPTLHEIAGPKSLIAGTIRYYTYRLRRIAEMAKQTPGAVFVTWEDIYSGKALPIIEEYLGLKDKLELNTELFKPAKENAHLTPEQINKAQEVYERYFFYYKNLNLLRVNHG